MLRMKAFFVIFVVASTVVGIIGDEATGPMAAIALINIGNVGPVKGVLELHQQAPNAPVVISGQISGLEPHSMHGFHVHGSGDIREGCTSTGGHFNPKNVQHGAPADSTRHVGDLGNIQADRNGIAYVNILDYVISLCGPNSIIGRAFVVHSGVDDLGRGGTPDSLKTGNAGSRIGCGIIGIL